MIFQPEVILAALERHRVRYVLIGGQAATLHGAIHVTEDVDITPDAAAENLERLSAALTDLEARIRSHSEEEGLEFRHDARSLARAQVWNLLTPYGPLDISFTPTGTQGYADLARDAITIVIEGVPTTVASLADIVRSKAAADRPKDHLSLPLLRRLLEEQGG